MRKLSRNKAAIVIVAAACFLVVPMRACADIFVMSNQGNTIVPVKEAQISMDSEIVEVTPAEEGAELEVQCTFLMTSHAKESVQRMIAFPIVHPMYGKYMEQHFTAAVDGKAQTPSLKMTNVEKDWKTEFYYKPDHEKFQYPGAMQWPVTWKPGQTRKIVCTYEAGSMEFIAGLVRGRRFRYVVRTGNCWKGPIGNATISVRFQDDPRLYADSENPDSVVSRITFPKQAKWVSRKEVRWTFSNWEPEEDIVVEVLRWRGLPKGIYRDFILPENHDASKQSFSKAYIDALVSREVAPWKSIFPEQTKNLDLKKLETAIVNILYHEIYARHGYAFVIGKYTGKPGREPSGVSIAPDKTMFGRWYGYFAKYGLHGGWYWPDRNKSLKAVKAELNEQEIANLAFLAQNGATKEKNTASNKPDAPDKK